MFYDSKMTVLLTPAFVKRSFEKYDNSLTMVFSANLLFHSVMYLKLMVYIP